MKSIVGFFNTCLMVGFFVLLPLLIFYLLLSELLGLVVVLATPIADLFPKGTFDKVSKPVIVAILLLVGVSFIFGLVVRSRMLARIGSSLERATLMRLPLYEAVKRLSQGLVSAEDSGVFKSGLLETDDGTTELVYIVEEHADRRLTILVPFAPAGFAGSVRVVSAQRVTPVSVSVGMQAGSLPIGASAWQRSWFPSKTDCFAQAALNGWQRNRRPFPESRWCASEDHGGWRPPPSLGSRRCRPSPCRRRIG